MKWIAEKRSHLNHYDLLVLTLIFFGAPIYWSNIGLLTGDSMTQAVGPEASFTDDDNLGSLIHQLGLLAIGLVYLHWRRFDWRSLSWGISWQMTLLGVVVYLGLSCFADLSFYTLALLTSWDVWHPNGFGAIFPQSLSLMMYSFFNGFYEELFFLGLFLAVPKERLWLTLALSLLVRFSFHTYQGMVPAAVIGLTGIPMALLYLRVKKLWPFFVAHAMGDMFGYGLV
ncbi:CPBP family intramembrane glutamic endopeptidase [uncultured Aquitalea sp.]|uniref:CPBP family intramembrane glutamic endopeptidase n=1 Tax=uncultured Aquitalea sp. TaxID=540272 RepID=UPI0025F72BE8|nr:CPBP family intramembrane glutamic endopeptidase [uncultured Aquitalea sp.]